MGFVGNLWVDLVGGLPARWALDAEGDVLVDIEQHETVAMEVDMERRVVCFHRAGRSSVQMTGLPSEVLGVAVLYAKKSQLSICHTPAAAHLMALL